MIELHFHHELYDGFAVDEAARIYAEYGAMDLVREEHGYVVRVTLRAGATAPGISERALGAEIANYALGKTIETMTRTAGAADSQPTCGVGAEPAAASAAALADEEAR